MKVLLSLCSSIDPDRRINMLSALLFRRDHQRFRSIWDRRRPVVRIHLLNGFINDWFVGVCGPRRPRRSSDCVCTWQRCSSVVIETGLALKGWEGGIRDDKRNKYKLNRRESASNQTGPGDDESARNAGKCFEQPAYCIFTLAVSYTASVWILHITGKVYLQNMNVQTVSCRHHLLYLKNL